MQEHTDAELVVLARRGEAEAFVHLVERYRLIASAVALRHLPDRESVRDIVQEAILQAYLSLDHLRDPARFKSWFYAIVVNTCRTWLRGEPPRGVSLEALDPAEVGAFGPDPQEVVEEHERVEAVRAALSMLSPHVRQVMASYYDDQLSIGEIAIRFGITPTAVRNRLYKGRNELRRLLHRAYPEVSPPAAFHRRKPTMIPMRLSQSIPQGRYTLAVLLEETGHRALPLWVRQEESGTFRSRAPESMPWADPSPWSSCRIHPTGDKVRYLIGVARFAMLRYCGQHRSSITTPRKAKGYYELLTVLSLDAPITAGSDLTLLDVLADDYNAAYDAYLDSLPV
jgi:RNA polymerase sigma factor (sigma-70 family)